MQAALLLASLLLPPLASAATIQTDLWVYANGDTVTVTGVEYSADETVEIVTTDPYAVEVDRGTAQTDAVGGFTYSFVLLSDVPGIYDVVGTGVSSGLTAATQFDPPKTFGTATSLALSSNSISYGGSTSLSGELSWTAASPNQVQQTKDGRTIHLNTFTTSSCAGSGTLITDATTSGGGATGTASYAFVYTPSAGTQYLQASFDGFELGGGSTKDTYSSSKSACFQLDVSKVATTTTGGVSIGEIFDTQSFTVSYTTLAAVGISGNLATGNISVAKLSGPGGSSSLGCTPASIALSKSQTASGFSFSESDGGSFTCTPTGGPGTYTMRVEFADTDGNYNNSNSSTLTVVVGAVHTTSLTETLSPSTITYGQQTTASGTLTDTTASTPIGLVDVSESERTTQNTSCGGSEITALGADATDESGGYALTFKPQAAGSFDIRARYAGDAGHVAAQACATLTVSKASTETSLVLADTSITTAESTTVSGSVLSHYGVHFDLPVPGGNSARGTLGFDIFSATDCLSGSLGAIGTDETVNVAQVNADNSPASEIGFSFASAGTHTINGLGVGTYGVRATFTDNNGLDGNYSDSSACQTLTVTSANTVPDAGLISGLSPVDEGSSHDYVSDASDPDFDVLTYVWSVVSGNATIAAGQGTDTVSLDFSDGPSTVVLHLVVDDGSGPVSPIDLSITVSNVAPTTSNLAGDATAAESSTTVHTYTYDLSDPGVDTLTAHPSCGVGGVLGTNSNTATGGSFVCTFPDGPASPTVSVYATDDDAPGNNNPGNTESLDVIVSNVAPTITNLGAGVAAACGTSNYVTINFFDPAGTYDTYSAHLDWGDSTSSELTVISSGVMASHVYASAGPHTVTVTVSDEDGGTSTQATATLIVNFNTSGILQPVNWTQAHQDPSIFKYGSTLPVKVQFFDCNGSTPGNLVVSIAVIKVYGGTPSTGIDEVITNTNSPDSNGIMRWSPSQYIYNLATKSLSDSSATYTITITVQLTGQTVQTNFGTKPK